MIESFWQDMELDASRQLVAAASARSRTIRLWKIRHLTFLVTGLLAFCTLLAGQITSERNGLSLTPWLISMAIALSLVLVSAIAIHSAAGLARISLVIDRTYRLFHRTVFKDYLSPYFYLAVFLILAPTIILILTVLAARLFVVPAEFSILGPANFYGALHALLTSLLSVAVGIIAAQVALFNFLFGQLLGKYASGVVQTVMQHPAVRAARWGAFLLLALVLLALSVGVPRAFVIPIPYFQNVVIALAFICFAVSIGIANRGVDAVHAIDLAGAKFAARVMAAVPVPIEPRGKWHLWTLLSALGLDWRDSRRFATIGQPKGGVTLTTGYIQILFGIAAKAIQDGKHDILLAACRAIAMVASRYLERRIGYTALDDQVFSYMNDQSAALVKSASKSVNEYLVTDVVRLVGALGLMSVSIGKLPADDGDIGRVNQSMQSHFLSAQWIGLLQEAVLATVALQRTHATGVAIDLMQSIALRLDKAGYDTPLAHTYLSTVEQVHALCVGKADAYGATLAAKCVRAVMKTWSQVLVRTPLLAGHGTYTACASESMLRMAKRSFAAEKGALRLDLNDFTSVVTARTSESVILLQDLALIAMTRKVGRNSERHAAADDVITLIELTGELGKVALTSGLHNARNYLDSLYSIASSIFEDWPTNLNEVTDPSDRYSGMRREPSNRDRAEDKLFETLDSLMGSLLRVEHLSSERWEHTVFSLIGIGLSAWKLNQRASLRSHIEALADKYERGFAPPEDRRLRDEDFAYLQLLGAWRLYYFDDKEAAERIAQFIGAHRPIRDSIYGSGQGRLSLLGYPTLHWSDFGIKRIDNRFLSDAAIERLRRAIRELVSDPVLVPYGEKVLAIQQPREEAYYEDLRQRRLVKRRASKSAGSDQKGGESEQQRNDGNAPED